MSAQRKLSAASKEDMVLLASCLWTTPVGERWKVMGWVHALGLMRFRGSMSFMLKALRFLRGDAGTLTFFKILETRNPEIVAAFTGQTIEHIINGHDSTSLDSVGGWSQLEVDRLQSKVTFSRLELPE